MRAMKTYLSTYQPLLLVLVMLCICLGPSAKSIAVSIAMISMLFSTQYYPDMRFIFSQSFVWVLIALCAFAIASCTWSIASPGQELSMLEKYCKLIYIPLFAAGFSQKKIRYYGIHAYLLGMCITCFFSLYYLHSHPGHVFYNHIITGYMVAFASYLSAWLAVRVPEARYKIGYIFLMIMFTTQVFFLNTSRTGYVVYIVLFSLFCVQHLKFKQIRYLMLILPLCLSVLIHNIPSNPFLHGMGRAFQDFSTYQLGQDNTSLGFRVKFHQYAQQLFISKPWTGYGIGSFVPQFIKDNPIPAWGPTLTDPHSQYWLTACELGIVGLGLLLCMLIWLSKISFDLYEMKTLLQAILLPFWMMNSSDSLLTNTGIGYLFVCFTGLCLGELIEAQRQADTSIFPVHTISPALLDE